MTENKQEDMQRDYEQQFKLIDLKFICEKTEFSKAYIYKLMNNKLFPKPLKIGRSSRWRLSEFQEWLDRLPREGKTS
ncbi:AlpA family phage regulatory protein [Citrobacter freundii]|jgi:predicted DNA-binding transcriptional regulator AlpA|uniref:helix-turn-helix transcriptional regulator n=1 Tax=Enterobacterales TaxID=91347 RepID=UPI0028640E69|nr:MULTISPECIES: AlpA family phage regulatory protein [Enterobacterales]MDR6297144.1 prophage regulatory protein [Pantoea dispersa]MDT7443240.1 AlpA family phage regulatory protein [Citrobacter freundii]